MYWNDNVTGITLENNHMMPVESKNAFLQNLTNRCPGATLGATVRRREDLEGLNGLKCFIEIHVLNGNKSIHNFQPRRRTGANLPATAYKTMRSYIVSLVAPKIGEADTLPTIRGLLHALAIEVVKPQTTLRWPIRGRAPPSESSLSPAFAVAFIL